MVTDAKNITEQAVFMAHGPTRLARVCGLKSRSAIHDWCRANRVPLEHLETVARESGFSAALLRPDIARIFGITPIQPIRDPIVSDAT